MTDATSTLPLNVGDWNLSVIGLVFFGLIGATIWGLADQAWQGWRGRRKARRVEKDDR